MITVYSAPECHACDDLKDYFRRKGVSFDARDITKSAADMAFAQKWGCSVPLTRIGNQVVVGFNKTELSRLLGLR